MAGERLNGVGSLDNIPPALQSFYTSRLRRDTKSLSKVLVNLDYATDDSKLIPCILDSLRPRITAWTADQRSTKSKISARYPGWTFNVSFEEADQAFEKKGTEEAAVHQTRLRAVLDDIFSSDGNACVGTAVHSDNINGLRKVLGLNTFEWPHGYIVPLLVKAAGMAIHAEAKVDLPARKEEQVKDSDEKKPKKDKEGRKEKGKKDRNPPMLRKDWAQDIGY